jgi:hypothetical protein
MNAAYLAVLVGLIMLSYGCIAYPPVTNPPPPGPGEPGLTKELCESARGHWNDCGSACRGAPEGTACIMMCVQYCECGGIAGFGCPSGYECSDYLPKDKLGNPVPDAMGICKKH